MSTWKRFLAVLGILAGLLVLFGHYLQRDSYRCRVCSTTKYESQWRLGLWMAASIPLTPKWQRLHETRFLHEVLAADHKHDWMFGQGSRRDFVQAKLQNGSLVKSNLVALVTHPEQVDAFLQTYSEK